MAPMKWNCMDALRNQVCSMHNWSGFWKLLMKSKLYHQLFLQRDAVLPTERGHSGPDPSSGRMIAIPIVAAYAGQILQRISSLVLLLLFLPLSCRAFSSSLIDWQTMSRLTFSTLTVTASLLTAIFDGRSSPRCLFCRLFSAASSTTSRWAKYHCRSKMIHEMCQMNCFPVICGSYVTWCERKYPHWK